MAATETRTCQRCGEAFAFKLSRLKNPNAKGRYCTLSCANAAKLGTHKRTELVRSQRRVCERCGAEFSEYPSRLAADRGHFCSKDCQYPITADQWRVIIAEWQSGASFRSLAVRFEVQPNAIISYLQRRGLHAPRARQVHSADTGFFDQVVRESQAYWLGFIAADGYVSRRGTLVIGLACQDREHLEAFKRTLNASQSIVERPGRRMNSGYQGQPIVSMQVCSRQIVAGLARYGIVNRKSLILRWPEALPRDLSRHFLRGYFDGDGCFSVNGQGNPSIMFTSSLGFVDDCRRLLSEELGTGSPKTHLVQPTDRYGTLRYTGGRQVRKIVHWLYDDATVYMQRKHDRVSHYLATCHPRNFR
jgi:hypothetical protein